MKQYAIVGLVGALVAGALTWALWNQDSFRAFDPGLPSPTQHSAAAANPCNPAPALAANPCNPCAARGGHAPEDPRGAKLDWGEGFASFARVSEDTVSEEHGNRTVKTYVSPQEAASVYEFNARLAREKATRGFRDYPVGTVLAMATFDDANALAAARKIGEGAPAPQASASAAASNPCAARVGPANPCNPRAGAGQASNPCNPGALDGKRLKPGNPCAAQDKPDARPGSNPIVAAFEASETTPAPAGFVPGPVFFMRKEAPGYDGDGGDWRYAATDPTLRINIGEGHEGPVQFCKSCHSSARGRGFVFAGGGS